MLKDDPRTVEERVREEARAFAKDALDLLVMIDPACLPDDRARAALAEAKDGTVEVLSRLAPAKRARRKRRRPLRVY